MTARLMAWFQVALTRFGVPLLVALLQWFMRSRGVGASGKEAKRPEGSSEDPRRHCPRSEGATTARPPSSPVI